MSVENKMNKTRPHEERREYPNNHEYSQLVINRLSRAIGHLESVKKMVEEGRDCTDILIQLSAVRGAINSISRLILKDHLEHCIVDALRNGDRSALDELNRAIDQMIQ